MIKNLLFSYFAFIASALLFPNVAGAQSPTEAAKGFGVFAENNLSLVTNESEGPVACGGDLTIKGNYQIALHSAGTFTVNNLKIGLLVGGKVNYTSGNALQVLSNSYVKIGNGAGSTVWYKDPNNATPPIRITPGGFDSSPRIELQANSPQLGVSVSNNPVLQGNLLDFSAAFQTLRAKSSAISLCTANAQLTNPNGQPIPSTNLPNQVKINLADGINYLNLSGNDLNAAQILTFNNQPSASKVLIVNVNAPGTFNWNVWNQAGIGFQNCPYILYNFYNTTQLNITGGATIEGTVFAPFANIDKSGNQSNLEGQVIAKSFIHSGGEVHYAVFSPAVTGCAQPVGVAPVADFLINESSQCLDTNKFDFKNESGTGSAVQPEAPISYLWNFGDGTTSTAVNPYKVYNTPGTYTVTLTATNTYGSSTKTKSVTIHPNIAAIVSQTTSAQGNGSITKQFTLTNAAEFSTYAWSLDGGSNLYANQPVVNFTFTVAGYYEVKVYSTTPKGCLQETIIPVVIASEDVSTGNNGGLESESLGDAIAKRYVQRKMKSVATEFKKTEAVQYNKVKMLGEVRSDIAKRSGNNQTLLEMFPSQLVAGDQSHVTSPTDILDYTVAQEVLSVDFSVGGKTKAVVLGIRTRDKVYNHTKASCDRLRGAEILAVKTVQLEGYNFLMQAIKQRSGITEYAISFAVAKNNNDANYTLQSNWFVKDYTVMNDMYNFQVWSTTPESTQKLVKDILGNLQSFIPVQQTEIQKMPKTYASKVSREGTEMVLDLKSVEAGQNIETITEEVYSETNGYAMRYTPVTSEVKQTLRVDIKDGYEYDGLINVEGETQDAFYHADGNWGLDYDGANTTIKAYTVSNDFDRVYNENEYAVHRNVKLQAHSNQDYLTLYKSLLPGHLSADYSNYGFLSFKAKGSGLLEIGLVKAGITEWKHQYKAVINVRDKEAVYYIPFSFMKSAANNQPMTADDLTMITYTFLPVAAGTNDLDLTVEDVKFTKSAPAGYEEMLNAMVNQFVMYPNPSQGNINCLLYSEVTTQANVTVHDITGKLVHRTSVNLEEGRNELNFDFSHLNSGMFFFNVDSPGVNYGTSKIVIK